MNNWYIEIRCTFNGSLSEVKEQKSLHEDKERLVLHSLMLHNVFVHYHGLHVRL